MTEITIYNSAGVRADLVDNEAIRVYCEGRESLEMTRDEWMAISKALEVHDDEV